MGVFEDLGAEQERLEGILGGLDEAQWAAPSGAAGWTIADVVLHLAHRTLPYAMTMAGQQPAEVWCELTAPDGESVWQFGSPGAASAIRGPAGAFCRVAARRLAPQDSGLTVTGPQGAVALRLLRTYAE